MNREYFIEAISNAHSLKAFNMECVAWVQKVLKVNLIKLNANINEMMNT